MKNKEPWIRILCVFIGMCVGITATLVCWVIKDRYKFSLKPVSRSAVSSFNSDGFWEKTERYYEDELNVFLDNYERIYNTYSLYTYLDNALSPYYEQYGYDVVLTSGLTSGSKMANIYCIEKCCEIVGDTKVNAKELSKALDSVVIDRDHITDNEDEQKYIDLAAHRLEIAKALFNGDYDTGEIYKNGNGKRVAWVANEFYGEKKIRLIDNGLYYTVNTGMISTSGNIGFKTNNILQLSNDIPNEIMIICISDRIGIFSISDVLYSYMAEQSEEQERESDNTGYIDTVSDLSYKDTVISGTMQYSKDYTSKAKKYRFTIDASRSEVTELVEQ